MTYTVTPRPGKTKERRRFGLRRLVLRGYRGTYMNRWGFAINRIGGVYLHRMDAPNPSSYSLHSHEWSFITVPLRGGYVEQRADITEPANQYGQGKCGEIRTETRRVLRPRKLSRSECHVIESLRRKVCWTLLFRGPSHEGWGMFNNRKPYVWTPKPKHSTDLVPYVDDFGYPFGGMYHI